MIAITLAGVCTHCRASIFDKESDQQKRYVLNLDLEEMSMSSHGILEAEPIQTETLEHKTKFEGAISAPPATNVEFHLTLLDASGMERKRRAASASISLFLQCVLVGSLLLIPLMN